MTYDPDADALMLRLSEAPVEESEEVAPNVVLDFDADGRVVGIEILFVSDLPDANPMELAYRILKEGAEKAAKAAAWPPSGQAILQLLLQLRQRRLVSATSPT